MNPLVFATNNENKVEEIRSILRDKLKIITLKEAGIFTDIPEPFNTLEENAREKTRFIYDRTGLNCFAEDTGLEVEALNGEPGVLSARYAGPEKSDAGNIEKLLKKMQGQQTRKARFRTVVSLNCKGKYYLFEGICTGQITLEKKGFKGFGYDPVFIPETAQKTFAEMNLAEKNTYSHRRKAVEALIQFLSQNGTKHSCF